MHASGQSRTPHKKDSRPASNFKNVLAPEQHQSRTYSPPTTRSLTEFDRRLTLVENLQRLNIPRIQVDPPVFQLATAANIERCFKILEGDPSWPFEYVGFDTETTVYRREDPRKISMIQIATRELCLIFQVYRIFRWSYAEFPRSLANFLDNDKILKVGVNATGDARWLKESYDINCSGIINLEDIARTKGINDRSLAELTLLYADPGLVLEKSGDKIRKWNFDAASLDPELVQYAAADAFAGFQIYANMLQDKQNPNYKPWEQRYPMSREEEEEEIYALLCRSFRKDKSIKMDRIINFLQSGYSRWMKTKPDIEFRRKEIISTIVKFLSDGRITWSLYTEKTKREEMENTDDANSDDTNTIDDITSTTKFIPELSVKLPGTSLDTLVTSENAIRYFSSKGLSADQRTLLEEIIQISDRPLRKTTMIRQYKNSETVKLLKDQSERSIGRRIEELMGKKAFISIGDRKPSLLFNPEWEKELEQIYRKEQDITSNDEEDVLEISRILSSIQLVDGETETAEFLRKKIFALDGEILQVHQDLVKKQSQLKKLQSQYSNHGKKMVQSTLESTAASLGQLQVEISGLSEKMVQSVTERDNMTKQLASLSSKRESTETTKATRVLKTDS